jgi:hypothetical protein
VLSNNGCGEPEKRFRVSNLVERCQEIGSYERLDEEAEAKAGQQQQHTELDNATGETATLNLNLCMGERANPSAHLVGVRAKRARSSLLGKCCAQH